MNRKMTVTACVLWLAGLAAFIAGLNIKSDTGKWLSVGGQIVFLVGLGLEGVLYYRRQKAAEKGGSPANPPENKKPEESDSPGIN